MAWVPHLQIPSEGSQTSLDAPPSSPGGQVTLLHLSEDDEHAAKQSAPSAIHVDREKYKVTVPSREERALPFEILSTDYLQPMG
jgi:hypothetical protein